MENDFSLAMNLRKWNRNMINAYWFLACMAIFGQTVYFYAANLSINDPIVMTRFVPSCILVILVLMITEIVVRWAKRWTEYIIIVSGAGIVTIFLSFHLHIAGLYNILFLPILISAFYFQVKKVLFAFTIMFLDCIVLFNIEFNLSNSLATADLISVLSILICGTIISIGIMHRGTELVKQLQSTFESKQDLLVRNIIMDRLSKIDPLTELYNHITFHEYLDRLVEQSDQFQMPLQLAVLDIDNFKKVNDTFGHRAGDTVLIRVAHILHHQVKPNDFVARYGGEEFAILFTEKDMEKSRNMLELIRALVEETTHPELQNQAVTISGGLINYEPGLGKEKFFHLADEALYKAKQSGKNRIVSEG